MKKIIFTSLTGNVDDLKEPTKITPGWEYICYSDNQELKSDVWEIRTIAGADPKKLSRYVKTHPPEADLTVYVDATFKIKGNLDRFALSKSEGIWLNSHPQRQCIYEEAEVVMLKELDKREIIDKHILRYREEGLSEQWGLWRCGIIVRDNNSKIKELNELWWKEIESGSWRDQISFPYACWKLGIRPNNILHGITNIYFKQSLHKPQQTDEWKFVGEGDYDSTLTKKYQGAHLIVLKNGLLFPKWISNYISMKNGKDRFIELVKILNGVVVNG
jgi:hypothetical protein